MSKIKQAKRRNDEGQLKLPRLFAWLASGVTVALIIVSPFLRRVEIPFCAG